MGEAATGPGGAGEKIAGAAGAATIAAGSQVPSRRGGSKEQPEQATTEKRGQCPTATAQALGERQQATQEARRHRRRPSPKESSHRQLEALMRALGAASARNRRKKTRRGIIRGALLSVTLAIPPKTPAH